jgi:hypothetical protein
MTVEIEKRVPKREILRLGTTTASKVVPHGKTLEWL